MKWVKVEQATFWQLAVFLVILFVLSSCNNGVIEPTKASEFDVSRGLPVNLGGDGDPFDNATILKVEIQMLESEFQQLRSEGRSLADSTRQCDQSFQYSEFSSTVSIDDTVLDNVVVRKKGYLGSLSPKRPSLKLYFAKDYTGRTYKHTDRLTLNNNRQDVSNVRQCLSYTLFHKAGLAAPKCSLASVTVNGEDLGLFSNVESIKEPFLRRVFGNDRGNLYEANLTDFGQHLNTRFEKKNNEGRGRDDLKLIADALAISANELFISQLKSIVDLDYFIRYWAMETLLGNWDSASGNANNFYLYRSQENEKFYFIPWGNDASFSVYHELKPDSSPLFRNFHLANRLYAIEAYRQQYFDTINEYLTTLWNERDLQSHILSVQEQTGIASDKIQSILMFISGRGEPGDDNYIPSQRERLQMAMASPFENGAVHLAADTPANCQEPYTSAIEARIMSINGSDSGFFRFTDTRGKQVNASVSLAAIETDSVIASIDKEKSPVVHRLQVVGADTNNAFKPYVLQIFIEQDDMKVGTFPLHAFANGLLLFEVSPQDPLAVKTLALSDDGDMTIHRVDQKNGVLNVDVSINASIVFPEPEDE